MTNILMPKLSDSMEQGTIISWFKATGDEVVVGAELLEIETDKSTAPYFAENAGVLEILAPVGTTVTVGELIARIGRAVDADGSGEPTADASADPESAGVPVSREVGSGPDAPIIAERSPTPVQNGNDQVTAVSLRATPLARRIAAAYGVALETVPGTGPLGRITRADVLSAAGISDRVKGTSTIQRPSFPRPKTAHPHSSPPAGIRRQELTRVQQLIASRMAEAKSTIPHFQVQTEADMGAAVALRGELKALPAETRAVPSINDLVIKAAATALRRHPLANGSYRDRAFELHEAINIGVAVAADDALVVPTVFNADTKSLGQIASETRRLTAGVRDGSLAPRDLEGGTFTVSNLGMFGMTAITPVINAPQAAILGVGSLRSALARVDGEIIDRSLVTLTLSCDHRILYGADAARFLAEIRDLLEAPLRLAL